MFLNAIINLAYIVRFWKQLGIFPVISFIQSKIARHQRSVMSKFLNAVKYVSIGYRHYHTSTVQTESIKWVICVLTGTLKPR